jgi:hypothetical protein
LPWYFSYLYFYSVFFVLLCDQDLRPFKNVNAHHFSRSHGTLQ